MSISGIQGGANPFKMGGAEQGEKSKGPKKSQGDGGGEGGTRQTVDNGPGAIMKDFMEAMIDMKKEQGDKKAKSKTQGTGFSAVA